MKVKATINCIGVGYEFKKGEVKEITNKKTAEKLLNIGYVEEIKTKNASVSKVKK